MSDSNRRDFLKKATSAGVSLGLANAAFAKTSSRASAGRVLGANDRINIGIIGTGGRGYYVGEAFANYAAKNNDACQITAVCDVYEKRKKRAAERFKCYGTLDWREVVDRKDLDAVIVATPDHWHARMALAAMDNGKDVYLEKPMCHTVDEARQLIDTVRETKRVLQVGSQTTSADQWYKAKKAIADGMIGQMLMSQGSYHRNSIEGEWNWTIDPGAGPNAKGDDYIDWKTWLGPAQNRPWDADRFFRFRKYWDYSGGIATDLFYHVVAPLNICWDQPQYPHKVMAAGGIYAFRDREVPDTFHMIAEYAKGHSLVLSSSMANSQHIPGLIRGHDGTIIMVEHGQFERTTDFITVKPEFAREFNRETKEVKRKPISPNYKFGLDEIKIPVEKQDMMYAHVDNFIKCMRSREKPNLDVETGAKAQVAISMAVQSFRDGKVLYFDEKRWKVTDKPPKA
jgi:predicted dehydrogenase